MSKKVLKDILESFDIQDSSPEVVPTRSTKKTLKSISTVSKKKQKPKQPKSTLEIYKALRSSQQKHTSNLHNLKRKFFKYTLDKSQMNSNKTEKPKGSVFTDKDFENLDKLFSK